MRPRSRRPDLRRAEDGVGLVEAAIALPIFFMFLFALLDLGLAVLDNSLASNGAREGGRVGILDHGQADDPSKTSADYLAVLAAVEQRTARDLDPDNVDVECREPDGTVIDCSAARVDEDLIRVTVTWERRLLTPIAAVVGQSLTISHTAEMVIEGRPGAAPTTIPPPATTTTSTTTTTVPSSTTTTSTSTTTTTAAVACQVTSITITPDPAALRQNDKLEDDAVAVVQTNGAPACANIRGRFLTPDGDPAAPHEHTPSGGSISWTFTEGKNEHSYWEAGTATFEVLSSSGGTVIGSKTFSVS